MNIHGISVEGSIVLITIIILLVLYLVFRLFKSWRASRMKLNPKKIQQMIAAAEREDAESASKETTVKLIYDGDRFIPKKTQGIVEAILPYPGFLTVWYHPRGKPWLTKKVDIDRHIAYGYNETELHVMATANRTVMYRAVAIPSADALISWSEVKARWWSHRKEIEYEWATGLALAGLCKGLWDATHMKATSEKSIIDDLNVIEKIESIQKAVD